MVLRAIPSLVPFALVACTSANESPVRGVTVAFSGFGCEMECPDYVIDIDSSLSVRYWGGSFAERQGYFQGRLSEAQWDSVQLSFERYLLHGIDTVTFARTDHPDFEMVIVGRSGDLHVSNNTGNLSDADRATIHSVMSLVERAKPLKPMDTLVFSTSEQYRHHEMMDDYRRRTGKDPLDGALRIDSALTPKPSIKARTV